MKIDYYKLHCTVIKNRSETQEEELDNYDNNNNYSYDTIIMPIYDIRSKPRETINLWRKLRSQINLFKLFTQFKKRRKMEKSRRCYFCNIDIHRAS